MIITMKKHKNIIENYKAIIKLKDDRLTHKTKIVAIRNQDIEILEDKLRDREKDYFEMKDTLEDEILKVQNLKELNEKQETKIKILETFIKYEYNKEIARLENIQKRTKKARVKKKCENRILDYKSRLLVFNK